MDKNIKNKISIIIATYNGYKYINQAIDSVLSQTYSDIEIIVVDDGSDDIKLKKVLSPYILNNLIKYIYIENSEPGAARNSGVKISSGEYLAFLDDDDYWVKDKLEKQFNLINNTLDFIVCYTDSFIIDPFGNIKSETRKSVCGTLFEGFIFKKLIFNNFITLSSCLIKKKVFIKSGMFVDSKSDLYMMEDYDLWLRLSQVGKFCYVNEPLVYYRTRLSLPRYKKINEYKKLLRLFVKNMRNSSFVNRIYLIIGWIYLFLKYLYHNLLNLIQK